MSATEYREAFQIFGALLGSALFCATARASSAHFFFSSTPADVDNDGIVSKAELDKMMKHMGNPLTEQELNDILKEAGVKGGVGVDYNGFTKLLGIGVKNSRNEENPEDEMEYAFSLFDKDKDGVISAKEMTAALAGFGVNLKDAEVEQLISEATMGAGRSVSYDVFKKVMSANRGGSTYGS